MALLLLTAGLAGLLLFTSKGRRITRRVKEMRLTTPSLVMALGGLLILKGQPMLGGGLVLTGLLWAGRTHTKPADPLAEARALLGVPPGADRAAIIAAHRRLMLAAHPDAGGNDHAASRLNAARDLLIDHSGA